MSATSIVNHAFYGKTVAEELFCLQPFLVVVIVPQNTQSSYTTQKCCCLNEEPNIRII